MRVGQGGQDVIVDLRPFVELIASFVRVLAVVTIRRGAAIAIVSAGQCIDATLRDESRGGQISRHGVVYGFRDVVAAFHLP